MQAPMSTTRNTSPARRARARARRPDRATQEGDRLSRYPSRCDYVSGRRRTFDGWTARPTTAPASREIGQQLPFRSVTEVAASNVEPLQPRRCDDRPGGTTM
jgi:hypothetical protein